MKLFHGTDTVVTKPEIRVVGYTKDFGYGFYSTHQIIFCNDKALATLKYVEHYEIKPKL